MNLSRDELLRSTTDQIHKKFGKGSIMKFGEGGKDLTVDAIPTGALALDGALGIGGVPAESACNGKYSDICQHIGKTGKDSNQPAYAEDGNDGRPDLIKQRSVVLF